MADIKLIDSWVPVAPPPSAGENWYAEPFSKKNGCQTPGQCGDDCQCNCPYNTMTNPGRLPLIESIARIFPNEWLAFILSPEEDDEYEPLHGKLIAHSPNPDEVHDAVGTVLWNQHVYVFFNGDFEAIKRSYGLAWTQPARAQNGSGVKEAPAVLPLPMDVSELIYSAIDRLYQKPPHLPEAVRRLRLARVKAVNQNRNLTTLLDSTLELIEEPSPHLEQIIWQLEEGLVDLGQG